MLLRVAGGGSSRGLFLFSAWISPAVLLNWFYGLLVLAEQRCGRQNKKATGSGGGQNRSMKGVGSAIGCQILAPFLNLIPWDGPMWTHIGDLASVGPCRSLHIAEVYNFPLCRGDSATARLQDAAIAFLSVFHLRACMWVCMYLRIRVGCMG